MVEKIMLDYLSENMTVPVFMEEPVDDLTSYVVLEKTGSSEANHIPTATIAVQSYGESLYDAASLNESVKTIMKDAIQLDTISAIRLNSDYNFTDTTTKKYRYQALFVVTYLEE